MAPVHLLGNSLMYSGRTWTVGMPTSSNENYVEMSNLELLKITVQVFWILRIRRVMAFSFSKPHPRPVFVLLLAFCVLFA